VSHLSSNVSIMSASAGSEGFCLRLHSRSSRPAETSIRDYGIRWSPPRLRWLSV